MAHRFYLYITLPLCLIMLFSPFVYMYPSTRNQLDYNFYDVSCPRLSMVVRFNIWKALKNDARMAASLLRLHFHDCLVNGCDGSVLLDDTKDFVGEKNAFPNRNSLRGFEVINDIKTDIEKFCPSTVSCVDILTLAARDAILLSGGPFWPVLLGRRDGTSASQKAANEQLPSTIEPLDKMIAKFTSKGLDIKDVVALSGGHTIGFAQCMNFKRRLFDFYGSGQPDPRLDSSFVSNLKTLCPNNDQSNSNLAPLDSVSTFKFDNGYYISLMNKTGLLDSDQALMGDPKTAAIVESYATNPYLFSNDFSASMVKLGNVGILTAPKGQVRKICGSVN